MTRRQLIEAARAKGVPLQIYQLHNAIATGKIPQPPDDGSGRYVYGDEHLALVFEIFGKKKKKATVDQ